ncbi:MAG: hypothetical protein Q8P24_09905 [Desulfobacterales bacterium]|nr:hypothetical protein [Desulfobacterales bacterium]
MHLYTQIYEFAASAGAFEGYVYRREQLDTNYLPNWVDHIVTAYEKIPPEDREKFQASCDQTIGRATKSLIPLLGEDHEIIAKLNSMTRGDLPESPDDFQKKKWFEKK